MSVLEQSCGPFKGIDIKLPEGAKVVDRIHDEVVIELDGQTKLAKPSEDISHIFDNVNELKVGEFETSEEMLKMWRLMNASTAGKGRILAIPRKEYKELLESLVEPLKDEWWDKILVVGVYENKELAVHILAWLNNEVHDYTDSIVDKEIIDSKIEKTKQTLEKTHKVFGWSRISLAMGKDRELKLSYNPV